MKPILFNTDMVQAIQAGNKRSTIRPTKPQPDHGHVFDDGIFHPQIGDKEIIAPYHVGDVLYVRETWWHEHLADNDNAAFEDGTIISRLPNKYGDGSTQSVFRIPDWKPTSPHWRKRPTIHMPKWAARIFLVVTSEKAMRLQGISEEEAKAEGMAHPSAYDRPINIFADGSFYEAKNRRDVFMATWNAIYSKRGLGWDANPWVFHYGFDVVSKEQAMELEQRKAA